MGNRQGHPKEDSKSKEHKKSEKEALKERKKTDRREKKDNRKKYLGHHVSEMDTDIDESSHVTGGDSESGVFHSAENISSSIDQDDVLDHGTTLIGTLDSPYSLSQHPHVLSSQDFQDGFSLEACIPQEIARSGASNVLSYKTLSQQKHINPSSISSSVSQPKQTESTAPCDGSLSPLMSHKTSITSFDDGADRPHQLAAPAPACTSMQDIDGDECQKTLSSSSRSSHHHPHFYNHHQDRHQHTHRPIVCKPSSPHPLRKALSPKLRSPTYKLISSDIISSVSTISPAPGRATSNFLSLFRSGSKHEKGIKNVGDNRTEPASQEVFNISDSSTEYKQKWKTWERSSSVKSNKQTKLSIFGTSRKSTQQSGNNHVQHEMVDEIKSESKSTQVKSHEKSGEVLPQLDSDRKMNKGRKYSPMSASLRAKTDSQGNSSESGCSAWKPGSRFNDAAESWKVMPQSSPPLTATAAFCIMKLEELERSIEKTIREKFPDSEPLLLIKRSQELRGSRSLPTTPSVKRKLYANRDHDLNMENFRLNDDKGATRYCEETYESPPSSAKSPVVLRRFGTRTRHASMSPKLQRAKTAALFNSPSELSGFDTPFSVKTVHKETGYQRSGTILPDTSLSAAKKSDSKYDNVMEAADCTKSLFLSDSYLPVRHDCPNSGQLVETITRDLDGSEGDLKQVIVPTFSAVFGSVSPKLRRHLQVKFNENILEKDRTQTLGNTSSLDDSPSGNKYSSGRLNGEKYISEILDPSVCDLDFLETEPEPSWKSLTGYQASGRFLASKTLDSTDDTGKTQRYEHDSSVTQDTTRSVNKCLPGERTISDEDNEELKIELEQQTTGKYCHGVDCKKPNTLELIKSSTRGESSSSTVIFTDKIIKKPGHLTCAAPLKHYSSSTAPPLTSLRQETASIVHKPHCAHAHIMLPYHGYKFKHTSKQNAGRTNNLTLQSSSLLSSTVEFPSSTQVISSQREVLVENVLLKYDDSVIVSTNQQQDSIVVSTNQHEDAMVVSTNQHEDAMVVSTNQHEDAVVVSTNQHEDAVVVSTNQHEDAVVESTNQYEDAVVLSTNQQQNSVVVSSNQHEDAVVVSSNQHEDVVIVRSNHHDDAAKVVSSTQVKGSDTINPDHSSSTFTDNIRSDALAGSACRRDTESVREHTLDVLDACNNCPKQHQLFEHQRFPQQQNKRQCDHDILPVLKQPVSAVISHMISLSKRHPQQQEVHKQQQQTQLRHPQQQHHLHRTNLISPENSKMHEKPVAALVTRPIGEHCCQIEIEKTVNTIYKFPTGHHVHNSRCQEIQTDSYTTADKSVDSDGLAESLENSRISNNGQSLSFLTSITDLQSIKKENNIGIPGSDESKYLKMTFVGKKKTRRRKNVDETEASDQVPPSSPTAMQQLMEELDEAENEETAMPMNTEQDMKQFTELIFKRLSDLLGSQSKDENSIEEDGFVKECAKKTTESETEFLPTFKFPDSTCEVDTQVGDNICTAKPSGTGSALFKVLTIETSSSLTTTTSSSSDSDVDETQMMFQSANDKDDGGNCQNTDSLREHEMDGQRTANVDDDGQITMSREYHSDDDVATGRGIPDYYDDRPLWFRGERTPGQLSAAMMAIRWRERKERWLKKRRRNKTDLMSTGSSDTGSDKCFSGDYLRIRVGANYFDEDDNKRKACRSDLGSGILTSPKYTKPILPFFDNGQFERPVERASDTGRLQPSLQHRHRYSSRSRSNSHVKHRQSTRRGDDSENNDEDDKHSREENDEDNKHSREENDEDDKLSSEEIDKDDKHSREKNEQGGVVPKDGATIEDTFHELMSVQNILVEMQDWRPAIDDNNERNCLPLTTENVRSIREYYKQCHYSGNGRRSRMSATDRTESDLDLYSEIRDDASSDSQVYADDEGDDDGLEPYVTAEDDMNATCHDNNTGGKSSGAGVREEDDDVATSILLSRTFYNSNTHPEKVSDVEPLPVSNTEMKTSQESVSTLTAFSVLNSDDEFWTGSALMDESYRQLEAAADAVSSTFQNAREQMHDIQYHLQALRRQMEVMQDDFTSISTNLSPTTSL